MVDNTMRARATVKKVDGRRARLDLPVTAMVGCEIVSDNEIIIINVQVMSVQGGRCQAAPRGLHSFPKREEMRKSRTWEYPPNL